MKASNTQRESGKFSDDPSKPGEKSDGIQKKHREKAGEHRKNLVIFRKYQEKEKTSKKLANTRKGRSFLAAPKKGGELPKSLVKLKKNPVFLLQHRKKEKSFRKNW